MSKNNLNYLKLGASLYVPAIHKKLTPIARGSEYPNLNSLIIDMEDAIKSSELLYAFHNVQETLLALELHVARRPLLFIRVRNPEHFETVKTLKNLHYVDGFVLPKFHPDNMQDYMSRLLPDYYYMPVLETNIFDGHEIEQIKDFLLPYKDCILSIRIGANDLLARFNLRRNCQTVIYNIGVVKNLITQIVLTFGQHGFNISAPVYECFAEENKSIIQQEVKLDLLNGLFGKTIIHPWQINVVQEIYQVSREEYEIASKLLDEDAPAVFKYEKQMHEKATHSGWAKSILERAAIYGFNC